MHAAAREGLFVLMVGHRVTATLKDGVQLTGVLHAIDPASGSVSLLVIENTKQKLDKINILGVSLESLVVLNVVFPKKTRLPRANRALEQWTADPEFKEVEIEDSKPGVWDQFAANESKFGVTTDWDENKYTVKIDRSVEDFAAKEAEAARIAREIENGFAYNDHIVEEREMDNTRGANDVQDEEEKYSSVIRDNVGKKIEGAKNGKKSYDRNERKANQVTAGHGPQKTGRNTNRAIPAAKINSVSEVITKTTTQLKANANSDTTATAAVIETVQKIPSLTPSVVASKKVATEKASTAKSESRGNHGKIVPKTKKFDIESLDDKYKNEIEQLKAFSKGFKLNTPSLAPSAPTPIVPAQKTFAFDTSAPEFEFNASTEQEYPPYFDPQQQQQPYYYQQAPQHMQYGMQFAPNGFYPPAGYGMPMQQPYMMPYGDMYWDSNMQMQSGMMMADGSFVHPDGNMHQNYQAPAAAGQVPFEEPVENISADAGE